MPEFKGEKVAKLYFNKENGYYELFSNSGEQIAPTVDIVVTDACNDFVTAQVKLFVNIVNERPEKK